MQPPPTDTTLRVTTVQPADDPRWDSYVARHADGEVYHCSGWIRSLLDEYVQPLTALACESTDGRVHGILPLIRTRGMPLGIGGEGAGARLSSLPRTPVAGPLASSADARRLLSQAAVELARETGVRLQLKLRRAELEGVVEGLAGVPWRPNYVVGLPQDPEALRFGDARNNATVRRAIRKAERDGVEVETAISEDELKAWYRLYLDVCRWRAQPARPYRFFAGLWHHLRPEGRMELLLARRTEGSRPVIVAGNLLLMQGETVTYAFNGRRQDALGSRPNDLLHWAAMQRAIAAGQRNYDLGEVDAHNPGLARYKAKWGATAEPTIRYYAPPMPESEPAGYGAVESGGRLKALVLGAWQRVPLRVTELAGDRVYRYL
jgi:CelD/BcsL family acetyltransferase involved in cellulose biosynthesis